MASPPTARGPTVLLVPDGDNRERQVCPDCGFINYENPKVVVGSVVVWEDRILLCRRAIDPRHGFWTLPAGYMELNESAAQAAAREAWEEAQATITIDGLLAVYSIPRISARSSPPGRKASRSRSSAGTRSRGTRSPFPRSNGRSTTTAKPRRRRTSPPAATRWIRAGRRAYLMSAAAALAHTSSCEPVPPEAPMAPISLPFSTSGMPPREPITPSRVTR